MTIFRVPSCIPFATFSVPFGLQNVIWNSIGKSTGYSLVGITHDWRVVILGDTWLTDNVPTAQVLNVADRSERRTLFEDIFGSSAFSNDDSESLQPTTTTTSSQVRTLEGNRHRELFDKPVYLIPAIDTLFDPLVVSLLSSRIPDVDPEISEANEEDEDVTMIDDTVKEPVFATRPTRIPDQGEMGLFTQLFRTTSTLTSTHFFRSQCTEIIHHLFQKTFQFLQRSMERRMVCRVSRLMGYHGILLKLLFPNLHKGRHPMVLTHNYQHLSPLLNLPRF